MLTPAVLVTIAYLLAMAALMIWLLRRQAKARAAYDRRAAIIAHIRREVDKDAPIVASAGTSSICTSAPVPLL